MNNMKTFLLLGGLTALLIFIGGLLGGTVGILIAVMLSVLMNMGAYWCSDKLVLSLYRARHIDSDDSSGLYGIVKQLAMKGSIPMPKVYMIDTDALNAFATGRNPQHASVAATTGLVRQLTTEELTGVMAHEISHVRHRDTLIMAVAATIGGAISGIANWFMWLSIFGGSDEEGSHPIVGILLMILAPIAAMLIQMAISRSREYTADEGGAKLCGHPEWLASALEKLEASHAKPLAHAETHPATAHLFIINPLRGKSLASLFATHPSTEERVNRLRAMRGDGML
tara:strand:- start:1394 stop:2245 length:852 start_codon:yes stop_codon:yes gene_type:complete